MSALSALRRPLVRKAVVCQPQLTARRGLGETVRGPPLTDLRANLRIACEFFTKGARSYSEFKQQCVSLRLFAFAGVTGGCALALFLDPPKSSYWQRYGPSFWFYNLRSCFRRTETPLFPAERVQHEANVPAIVDELLYGPKVVPTAVAKDLAVRPKVLFVLGGPGAGKGTQCAKICETFGHWAHVSAGDCLRAERNDPASKDGELINTLIKEGSLVPSEITVGVVQRAMNQLIKDGKRYFLVDGFPRSLGNVEAWEKVVGDKADVLGVLFYEAKEEAMEKRLLGRGEASGRNDDNIETIKKRFQTYMKETMPIVERYASEGMVYSIDGMPPPEAVWEVTQAKIKAIEAAQKKTKTKTETKTETKPKPKTQK